MFTKYTNIITLAVLVMVISILFSYCKKKEEESPEPTVTYTKGSSMAKLRFVLKLDSTQVRLDNIGNPSSIPSNHKAQSPRFNKFGIHYIELAADDTTGVGRGSVLYITPNVSSSPVTVTSGTNSATFNNAIDFDKLPLVNDGEELFSIPLATVKKGIYKWFRMSIAYQNYDVNYKINAGTVVNSYTLPSDYYGTGTLASFVGYNTYINAYKVKNQTVTVNNAKLQGYWGFETSYVLGGTTYTSTPSQGQAPSGATTVVNPLFSTSPIPPGSCLVTGQFVNLSKSPTLLTINGTETEDITIIVSVSTNNSFEWVEHSGDNHYNPLNGDTVVNMGLRGLIPIIQP